MKMIFKSIILIVTAIGAYTNADVLFNEDLNPTITEQNVLTKFIIKMFSERFGPIGFDDVNANVCFEQHEQTQIAITNAYNKEYNICIETAANATEKLNQESTEKRLSLTAEGREVCQDLNSCEVHNDALEFFECYTEASKQNSPVLYDISVASNAQELNLNVQSAAITNEKTNCTTLAMVTYINALTAANKGLQICLSNPVAPTQPPQATTKPPQATTEPPEVPTQPPEVTTQPPEVTTLPPEVTTLPAEVTTQPPEVTTQPSEVATQPSLATTQPAEVPTQPPEVTTQPPEVTTQPPEVTTQPSEVATQPPQATTQPAEVPTEPPEVTTQPPEVTTQPPEITTQPSEVATQPPEVTTQPAEVPTQPPEVTTAEPLPEEDLDTAGFFKRARYSRY